MVSHYNDAWRNCNRWNEERDFRTWLLMNSTYGATPARLEYPSTESARKAFEALKRYISNDVTTTKETLNMLDNTITKVIFNNPATIVFWGTGTKTVVKASENERFDPEKGLAMAIAKHALGNKGNYYNEFKKWLPKEKETATETIVADGQEYMTMTSDDVDNFYLIFNTREEAETILKRAHEILIEHGFVTRSDMYDLVGARTTFADNTVCWRSLKEAVIERKGKIYRLRMPGAIIRDT